MPTDNKIDSSAQELADLEAHLERKKVEVAKLKRLEAEERKAEKRKMLKEAAHQLDAVAERLMHYQNVLSEDIIKVFDSRCDCINCQEGNTEGQHKYTRSFFPIKPKGYYEGFREDNTIIALIDYLHEKHSEEINELRELIESKIK